MDNKELLSKAKSRDHQAELDIYLLHRDGKFPLVGDSVALEFLRKSVKGKNRDAMFEYGMILSTNHDYRWVDLLEKAANLEHEGAIRFLAYNLNSKDALQYILWYVRRFPNGADELLLKCLEMTPTPSNYKDFLFLYNQAHDRNLPNADYRLGYLYLSKATWKNDFAQKALGLFCEADSKGNFLASVELFKIYSDPSRPYFFFTKDESKAKLLLEKLYDAGEERLLPDEFRIPRELYIYKDFSKIKDLVSSSIKRMKTQDFYDAEFLDSLSADNYSRSVVSKTIVPSYTMKGEASYSKTFYTSHEEQYSTTETETATIYEKNSNTEAGTIEYSVPVTKTRTVTDANYEYKTKKYNEKINYFDKNACLLIKNPKDIEKTVGCPIFFRFPEFPMNLQKEVNERAARDRFYPAMPEYTQFSYKVFYLDTSYILFPLIRLRNEYKGHEYIDVTRVIESSATSLSFGKTLMPLLLDGPLNSRGKSRKRRLKTQIRLYSLIWNIANFLTPVFSFLLGLCALYGLLYLLMFLYVTFAATDASVWVFLLDIVLALLCIVFTIVLSKKLYDNVISVMLGSYKRPSPILEEIADFEDTLRERKNSIFHASIIPFFTLCLLVIIVLLVYYKTYQYFFYLFTDF